MELILHLTAISILGKAFIKMIDALVKMAWKKNTHGTT